MREHDRATDDEGDVEALPQFLIGTADLDALIDVVADAIITPQHHAGAQTEQLFGFSVERAGLVAVAIERKEPLRLEGAGWPLRRAWAKDSFIETITEGLELLKA